MHGWSTSTRPLLWRTACTTTPFEHSACGTSINVLAQAAAEQGPVGACTWLPGLAKLDGQIVGKSLADIATALVPQQTPTVC